MVVQSKFHKNWLRAHLPWDSYIPEANMLEELFRLFAKLRFSLPIHKRKRPTRWWALRKTLLISNEVLFLHRRRREVVCCFHEDVPR